MEIYTVKHIMDCFGKIAYSISKDVLVERRSENEYVMFKAVEPSSAVKVEAEYSVQPCYDSISGRIVGFIKI